MALSKQPFNLNFASGLDTKTDPRQVAFTHFLSLENSVFTTGGALTKRNGFGNLTSLQGLSGLTTFGGNLVGLGLSPGNNFLSSFSGSAGLWGAKTNFRHCGLSVASVVKSNTNQVWADSAVSPGGLACTVFTSQSNGSSTYSYQVSDTSTGQVIIAPTLLAGTSGSVSGAPKVRVLGSYFFIVFPVTISANVHLQYVAVSTVTLSARAPVDIVSNFYYDSRGSFDMCVANNAVYLVYASTVSERICLTYFDATLTQHLTLFYGAEAGEPQIISICADTTTSIPTLYVAYSIISFNEVFCGSFDANLNAISGFGTAPSSLALTNITCSASGGLCTVVYEQAGNYGYNSSIANHTVGRFWMNQAGAFTSRQDLAVGVGLASKSFFIGSDLYVLVSYQSTYQSTYFLLYLPGGKGSTDYGQVAAILAHTNGQGYLTYGLPDVALPTDTSAVIAYLYQETLTTVNTANNAALPTASGAYATLGVNSVTFNFDSGITKAEIGSNLHLSGGFVSAFDGSALTEQNFFLFPDNVNVATSTSGGAVTAQAYFYRVIYEWCDNAGNIHRSAPSVPVSVTTTGSTSTNTVYIPMLGLTYKTASPVKICVYRYSAGQQTYYEVTSQTSPLLNDPTTAYATFTDTLADTSILGNDILYTTGGVVEDLCPPATRNFSLFNSRLWALDAEDGNTLWFSKQVLEATPVEFSDLLTIYVAPTIGNEGSTGPITCHYPMDDKLIVFKQESIFYISGVGPDNTGANSGFGDPVFITTNVGCSNPDSLVLTQNGIMFQSDKGIWLLGRDLSVQYIGAAVEAYNSFTITSAFNIPSTNQIRFTLAGSPVILMYDTYYGQWGTFRTVSSISSTLYDNAQVLLDNFGRVYSETPGVYLDGSQPVTMQFTTSWLKMSGLQGYQRAYFFYLLGTYITPYTLTVGISFDYQTGVSQVSTVSPGNFSAPYGGDTLYGGSEQWGGPQPLAQNRIFLDNQRCEAVQISVQENFDPSMGAAAGAGLTLSGINMVLGMKNIRPTTTASQNVGSNPS